MKRIMNMLLACCAGTAVVAQQANVRIEGTIGVKADSAFLHLRHFDGMDFRIPVDAKGVFRAGMHLDSPGFYLMDKVGTVYLKPGYSLKISAQKNGSYVFAGTGAAANDTLVAIKGAVGKFLPCQEGVLTQEAYYTEIPVFLEKVHALEASAARSVAAVKDSFFSNIAVRDFHYYCNSIVRNYYRGYGIDQEKYELYKKLKNGTAGEAGKSQSATTVYQSMFVKRMDTATRRQLSFLAYENIDMNDALLLRQSEVYRKEIETRIQYVMLEGKYKVGLGQSKEVKLRARQQAVRDLVSDPLVLAYFHFQFTEDMLKVVMHARLMDSLYLSFMATPGATAMQKQTLTAIYHNRQAFTENRTAPDFTYVSVEGKPVTLSSFRGKYVYIDVWATWCGPCKAQIPFLTKVEELYHDKNIQFVSLSIDKPADKQKWVDYVTAHQLKGIQVVADNAFNSEFVQKFNITSIPRFILIDPDGKIVSPDARRPSDPELRKQLDTLLNKHS